MTSELSSEVILAIFGRFLAGAIAHSSRNYSCSSSCCWRPGSVKVENEALRDVLAKKCIKQKLSGMVDLVGKVTSDLTSEVMEAG